MDGLRSRTPSSRGSGSDEPACSFTPCLPIAPPALRNMMSQTFGGDILEFGLYLEVAPGQVARHEIVDRLVPHQVRMGSEILESDAGPHERGEIGQRMNV